MADEFVDDAGKVKHGARDQQQADGTRSDDDQLALATR